MIRDAMPQADSIDNFIDAHRDDKNIALCGKLGIISSILEKEKGSPLYIGLPDAEKIKFKVLEDTWYSNFFKLLIEGVSKNEVEHAFENISFITFNYDRCIEHYLLQALINYYVFSESEAQRLVNGIPILHPYGRVGRLPWQSGNSISVLFGGVADILSIVDQIKTFTEQIEDQEAISEIRNKVLRAETIVFLGFAFHRQNMELIAPGGTSNAKRVFATAFGISDQDCLVVKNDIIKFFKLNNANIELRNHLKCAPFLSQYQRSLSQA
ncbi:MAG: hypothetical protein A3G18_02705 [Rhodospirillales bacterium RIFCSPLOWO2_12_FULL_58_28]|nr:MAG: hypothetical protein A3H92_09975 [Rhodospirillales bacterium RIFCSPLOWO2_02_FULL_58_16]OHC79469.1 MAG: hypothetical protein A3G18_02705 [Rhodospirillales bacterium RIFCSPLOWO2_12_FULL_58_28]